MAFKCNNIFWLEDNPNFLTSNEFNLSSLLSRITWAHSLERGKEIIAKDKFDLHILDGDFPDRLPAEREIYLENYLKGLREGDLRQDFKFDDGLKYGGEPWDKFLTFYNSYLDASKKVIVFSMSKSALELAFKNDIPFYSKWYGKKEGIIRHIQSAINRRLDPVLIPRIKTWEYGTSLDLVNNYLL